MRSLRLFAACLVLSVLVVAGLVGSGIAAETPPSAPVSPSAIQAGGIEVAPIADVVRAARAKP